MGPSNILSLSLYPLKALSMSGANLCPSEQSLSFAAISPTCQCTMDIGDFYFASFYFPNIHKVIGFVFFTFFVE